MPVLGEAAQLTLRLAAPAILLASLLILPFLNKPFHIDDPVYIWVADQIRRHPLDFYGFSTNWHGVTKPMYETTKATNSHRRSRFVRSRFHMPTSSYLIASAIMNSC